MREEVRKLLNLAIMAPSGDNCQPWQFAVNDLMIDLYNRPDLDTSFYNYLQRASLVSHGAVLENIAIAAPTLGLKADIQFFPEAGNLELVARIVLDEASPRDSELAPFIPHRATNRKKYSGGQLNADQIAALKPEHADLKRVSAFLTSSGTDLKELAEVISLSDRLVFEVRQLHDFLFDHIRWNDEDAQRYRDGLDVKTLELNPFDTLGFKLLKSWAFASLAGKIGITRIIAGNARRLVASASAVGLILAEGQADAETYLEGGRLMQRIWLQATRLGLGFHPMTGISFLMQRTPVQLGEAMPLVFIRLIEDAVRRIARVSKVREPVVVGIFRVGMTAPPSARSLRRELSKFVI